LPGSLPRVGPDKAVSVAVQVEATGTEIVAPTEWLGDAPMLLVQLGQCAPRRQTRQLLQQQAPFPSAAQAHLAHQLLVSGLAAGIASNPRHQFQIGHSSRVPRIVIK